MYLWTELSSAGGAAALVSASPSGYETAACLFPVRVFPAMLSSEFAWL